MPAGGLPTNVRLSTKLRLRPFFVNLGIELAMNIVRSWCCGEACTLGDLMAANTTAEEQAKLDYAPRQSFAPDMELSPLN